MTRPLLANDFSAIAAASSSSAAPVPPAISRTALHCLAKCVAEVADACGAKAAADTAQRVGDSAQKLITGMHKQQADAKVDTVNEQHALFYLFAMGELGRKVPDAFAAVS